MKKYYLLLLCAVLFLSCNTDDDSASNDVLNPPEWLHGSWEDERSQNGSFTSMSIEVSSDNIKVISGNGISVFDIGNQVRNMEKDPNSSASVEELANDEDSYEFTLKIFVQEAEWQRTTYRFVRNDGQSIMFYQNSTGLELFKI